MITVKVCDEIESINGIEANEVFKMRKDLDNARGDIFLVKEGDRVLQIEIGSIIKANYKFDTNLSIEETAQQWLIKHNEEIESQKAEELTLEEMQEQLALLSYQVMMMQENKDGE